ncbi:MAG TPA: hypothetical protein VFT69_05385 [Pseudolabrys sp.]|jgi:hypothetical protein|nr:hypothetical protein [Pseudolabrys sp.]
MSERNDGGENERIRSTGAGEPSFMAAAQDLPVMESPPLSPDGPGGETESDLHPRWYGPDF